MRATTAISKRVQLFLAIAFLSLPLQAKILRSAALYYAPERQIEANTTASYYTLEHFNGLFQTRSTVTTVGGRIEHGMNDFLSWGGQFNYGMGSHEIKTSINTRKTDYEGLLDPEVYVKSHYETENMRFHANGIFAFKSDPMILSYDRSPLNFSSGGSSFALLLGMEGALGPTLLGLDLKGDVWKDSQEVIEKNAANLDTTYFRDGGKQLSFSIFGELNNLRSFKPGLRLRGTQIEASRTEIQENQIRSLNYLRAYELPRENQWSLSFYGRIRLPAHFVLNFEVYGMDSAADSPLDSRHYSSYGLLSNVGFKF